ncbi:hypothetical protein HFO56_39375 [Rhizobium laguerreae]|uniref:hypothetical protein n=1 Tax=Rhizobium laguerreae TaxID=1076926 RepID=UPI001C913011|nr:hypothetical protein [Rhizobium laguerreae]MBY3158363.1 hypothetical protein [Rhizobium laguerreae]
MTTQIVQGDTFLGYPATTLKSLLTSWSRGKHDAIWLASVRSLNLSVGACAAFLDECHQRGFFEIRQPAERPAEGSGTDDWLVLSVRGLAIMTASTRKRVPKARAERLLSSIITNATALSSDPRAPVFVRKIWVFGSYIDESKGDLGLLDVAFDYHWRMSPEFYGNVHSYLDETYPGTVPNLPEPPVHEHWLEKAIFGGRRSPSVSTNRIAELLTLYCPCRLVFDSERGGEITPEDYTHHPDTTALPPANFQSLVMPELNDISETFEPTTASVFVRDALRYPAVYLYASQDDLPHGLLPYFDGIQLDGRRSFAACIVARGTLRPRACFLVDRSVECEELLWRYTMRIRLVHLGRRNTVEGWYPKALGSVFGTLFNADMLRLADRRSKLSVTPTIELESSFCERSARIDYLVSSMQTHTDDPDLSLPDQYKFAIRVLCDGVQEWEYTASEESEEDNNESWLAR